MGLYFNTARCAAKLFLRRLFHPGSIQGSVVQGFKRPTLELHNKGRVLLGEKSQSRDGLTLIADGGTIEIGRHCQFNTNVSITSLSRVRIGERCSFANNVVIVDHDHFFRGGIHGFASEDVVIGVDVWVGANVVILKGVHVADHCVVAAGAVVTKDVQPAYSIWGGCPARMISMRLDAGAHEQ